LPIVREFLVFKKVRLGKQKTQTLPEFLKTVKDVAASTDQTRRYIQQHDTKKILTNAEVGNRTETANAAAHMFEFVKRAWRLICAHPDRFCAQPPDPLYLDVSVEDWVRAYYVVQHLYTRIERLVTAKAGNITPAALMWGEPHGGQAEMPAQAADGGDGGDGQPAGAETDGGRSRQILDADRLADVGLRLRSSLLTAAGGDADGANGDANGGQDDANGGRDRQGRNEERAARQRDYETVTTAIVTGAGYPKPGEIAGRVNHAPAIRREDGAAWIEAMQKRVVMQDGNADGVDTSLDRLLELANSAGAGGAVQADMARRDRAARHDASVVDAAMDADALRALRDDMLEGVGALAAAPAMPAMTTATILTSEATTNMAGFEDTMKHLGWQHRLAEYYKSGKVLLQPESAHADRKAFGLTAGQVVGKFPNKGPPQVRTWVWVRTCGGPLRFTVSDGPADIGTMQMRLQTAVRAVILANEAGAGKTFALMGNILADAQRAAAAKTDAPFLPSLVVVPSNLCGQYVTEFIKSFLELLEMAVWYGSTSTQDRQGQREGLYVGKSVQELRDWYNMVPATDARNARRFVVTSYDTFRQRAGTKVDPPDGAPAGTEPTYLLQIDDLEWSCVYLDEGHAVKNHNSIVGRWLCDRTIRFRAVVFVTATPLINSAQDMYGYLKIVWRGDWPLRGLRAAMESPEFPFRDFYGAKSIDPRAFANPADGEVLRLVDARVHARDAAYARIVDEMADGRPWHVLYPWAYFLAFQRHGTEPWFASDVLAPIMEAMQSRRLLTTQVWDGRRHVVAEIPEVRIRTRVVDFVRAEDRSFYDGKVGELARDLYIPQFSGSRDEVFLTDEDQFAAANDSFDVGTMDANVFRQLRVLTTHPRLYFLIACDRSAEHVAAVRDELIAAMVESQHVHDYPAYTELVRKKVDAEGARRVAAAGARGEQLRGNTSGGTVDDLTVIRDSDRTGGLALLYLTTTREPEVPFPSTERLSVLRFCLLGSPKLVALMVRLWQICRERQFREDVAARKEKRDRVRFRPHRVIVFLGNPMTAA
jgi:hypothetical protein